MPEEIQTDIASFITELANRIKSIERKQDFLTEKLLMINQNLIQEYKKLTSTLKSKSEELDQLKKEFSELKNVLKHLTEEAVRFARKEDLDALENYINLWNPLKFVTEQDLKKILEEVKKHASKTRSASRRSTSHAKKRSNK